MKIAILGGGFTGLTAAYDLQKKGHAVTLFEKEPVLGGLAVGFKQPNWDWYLERAYHHLFANDHDILDFAKEIGFENIYLNSPETASLYEHKNIYRIIPLDSPQDLLRFPYLSLPDKLRAGMVLAFLKTSPFLSLYEKQTAEEFIKKYMGKRVWNILWQELFRKKFGKYAENILSSFIWARINKRTKDLAYIRGGFQTFIDHIEHVNTEIGIETKKRCGVENIIKNGETFEIYYSSSEAKRNREVGSRQARTIKEDYDIIVSTLPSLLLSKVAFNLLPQNYLARFKKLNYLHAVVLILETKQPLLEKAYWLNISTSKLPVMGLMQHTNLIDKKYYGGNHILYAANYVDRDDKLIKMSDKEVLDHYLPQLQQINSKFIIHNSKFFVFKGPFAQPIFDKEFVKNKPDFITPVKNFYIANLDMTYPYDRGTNYAVKLGRDVAKLI